MTGRIYQKSSPNIKTFLPNGLSMQVISQKVLSIASKSNLCNMGASSHTKSFATLIK